MECPRHKGREMVSVLSEEKTCLRCQQPLPRRVVGFRCLHDRQEFAIKKDDEGNDLLVEKPQ